MTKHDGKEKKIRSPMAVAIVKLLTHFPMVVLQDYVRLAPLKITCIAHTSQLPALLLKVTVVLRDKEFDVRESARKTLLDV